MSNSNKHAGPPALTDEQLVAACKNIGYDLTCGACAAVFYTGTGMVADKHTCAGPGGQPGRIITPGGTVCDVPPGTVSRYTQAVQCVIEAARAVDTSASGIDSILALDNALANLDCVEAAKRTLRQGAFPPDAPAAERTLRQGAFRKGNWVRVKKGHAYAGLEGVVLRDEALGLVDVEDEQGDTSPWGYDSLELVSPSSFILPWAPGLHYPTALDVLRKAVEDHLDVATSDKHNVMDWCEAVGPLTEALDEVRKGLGLLPYGEDS